MGGYLFSSEVRRNNESSSSLFDQFPLSTCSSPLPLLGKAATKTPTVRRHVIVRFICAPFTAVFRMKCAGASSGDDELNIDNAEKERREARRPSLEELLRMEEEASTSCLEHKSPQDTAVSCCLKDRAIVVFEMTNSTNVSCALKEEPLSLSKSNDNERQIAILPVKVDVGGSSTTSPAVPISASLRRAFLQAMRMDTVGRMKDRYWKLDGSRAVGYKPDLFYQRPIPMGRRCQVQHLEESPYM